MNEATRRSFDMAEALANMAGALLRVRDTCLLSQLIVNESRRIFHTPAAILQRVNREMDAILKDPAVTGRMSNAGFISRGGGTIDETRAYVQAQHAAWGKLVQEIGLQPE